MHHFNKRKFPYKDPEKEREYQEFRKQYEKSKTMDKERILKEFMLEQFDFDGLKECGIFKGIKRNDYQKQAERICEYFGFKTVFEYGAIETKAHLTFDGDRPLHINPQGELKQEPFVTVVKSIY